MDKVGTKDRSPEQIKSKERGFRRDLIADFLERSGIDPPKLENAKDVQQEAIIR